MKKRNKTEIMVLCCTECNECYDAVNGHKMSWRDVEDNNDPEYNYVTQDGKCEKCLSEIKEMEPCPYVVKLTENQKCFKHRKDY